MGGIKQLSPEVASTKRQAEGNFQDDSGEMRISFVLKKII